VFFDLFHYPANEASAVTDSVWFPGTLSVRVYSSNSQCDRQRGIFALSKTFFRRNTDVFQGKMAQRSVKRPAVRVRWELEEYTLAL
jgi:hypothetical protein